MHRPIQVISSPKSAQRQQPFRALQPSKPPALQPVKDMTTEGRTQASQRGWTLPRWTTFNSPQAQDGDMAEHMRQHAVDSEELR